MPRLPAALCLSLVLAAAAAHADQIVTKNGTVFDGKIVSEDSTHYAIETPDLGRLRVAKTDVMKIHRGADAPTAPNAAPAKPDADGAKAAGADDRAAPAKPTDDEAEAEAARKAEQERLDAEARMARRRAATLRRTTTPGAEKAAAEPVKSSEDEAREKAREQMTGAAFASTAKGSLVVVFEPSRPFRAAPAGIVLGRRTWAQFEVAGAASASLTVPTDPAPERVALRLADVQRHIVAKTDASRIRLFEGISAGDWVRATCADGTEVSGRYADAADTSVKLLVPQTETAALPITVDAARIVRVDGLLASTAVSRALIDLEPGEPVGIVLWPSGEEIVGRFADRMEHQVRLDTDADGEPDRILPVDAPIADVRRVPTKWRETTQALKPSAVVRVRGFEEFPDARVERVTTAQVLALTAYAISVKTSTGAAVVPFDAVVSLDPATAQDASASLRAAEVEGGRVKLLPGTPVAEAAAMELPAGVSYIGNGTIVTHVYVSAPCEASLWGVHVGARMEDCTNFCELNFATEVTPRGDGAARRPKEFVSESVPGIRVTVCADSRGIVSAIELARR